MWVKFNNKDLREQTSKFLIQQDNVSSGTKLIKATEATMKATFQRSRARTK